MHVKTCLVLFVAMNLIGVQCLEECWRGCTSGGVYVPCIYTHAR